ncbi:MAG: ABC transporter ATP-binding protein [Deltaproteobacteria bacterium]|nr:ABC transporter ATP-binding protein [Deltaproteobacteria bacterium]MBW1943593.1 ABC transporter ATP-binding protein [Deltaproteobacteria bacterium]MBW2207131.1 ABC transporter ATP-binding protein [Deltaproteobacteria bacterium]
MAEKGNHQDQRKPERKLCLTLKGLSKNFGSLAAVININLEVLQGERRAIIGANGAGKTTLFDLIGGQLRPSAGHVSFLDRDITRMRPFQRAHLGLTRTYQITNLFPSLSVLYNVILGVQALEKTKFVPCIPITSYGRFYDQAEELLDRLGLLDKKEELVQHLPYGEQRLIELAIALAGKPKLLLLDEPTSGLPAGESKELTKVLMALDPETTIIIVEHDMDVAFSVAERVTVLHLGEILAEGTTDEIKNNAEVQRVYLGEEEEDE